MGKQGGNSRFAIAGAVIMEILKRYWPTVYFSCQLSQELQMLGGCHLPWETTENVSFEQGG